MVKIQNFCYFPPSTQTSLALQPCHQVCILAEKGKLLLLIFRNILSVHQILNETKGQLYYANHIVFMTGTHGHYALIW